MLVVNVMMITDPSNQARWFLLQENLTEAGLVVNHSGAFRGIGLYIGRLNSA